MKRISLLLLLILLNSFAILTFAHADDLDDLDALLNDVSTDTGSIQQNTGTNQQNTQTDTTPEAETITGTNTQTTTGENEQAVEKIQLQLTGDVSADSVKLTFNKVGDYTDYKIYYAPEGDDNLQEKEVTLTGDTAVVAITGLNSNTKYKFIAKAFDQDGNPVEATTSDPLYVTTAEKVHAAPADNVIYNPVIKVQGHEIIITWQAGADAQKVQISMSEDGKIFKPVATVDAKTGKYTIDAKTTGKKYIKLLPIASDGTLGVCKVGATEVAFVTANVQPKKEATKKIWHPRTGPETYLLIFLALAIAAGYVYKRRVA